VETCADPRLKGKDLAAIRTNPGNVVTRHPPEVLLHAFLTDLESTGTAPAETATLFAADTILFNQSLSRIFAF
jgi:hypothetical protein